MSSTNLKIQVSGNSELTAAIASVVFVSAAVTIVAARVPGPQAQGVALCSALVTIGLTALMSYNLYEGRRLSGLLASATAELPFWRSEYASSVRLYKQIYN